MESLRIRKQRIANIDIGRNLDLPAGASEGTRIRDDMFLRIGVFVASNATGKLAIPPPSQISDPNARSSKSAPEDDVSAQPAAARD
jgi:hypothetical protein